MTTNLQIYWDNILIDRTPQGNPQADRPRPLHPIPLSHADLEFHGYPYKIEGTPAGNVRYVYEKTSATGPYTRPLGTYTRYGDVLPLLTAVDDKLAIFGSGDEVRLDFDPSNLPQLAQGLGARLFLRRQRLRKRYGLLRRGRELRRAAARS